MTNVQIDFRTLVISLAVLFIIQAAILLVLLKAHRDYTPTRYWAQGALVTALGAVIFILRGPIPEGISILVGNALLIGGTELTTGGLMIACSRRPPWRLALVLWGAALVGIGWFSFVEPSLRARVEVYQTALSLILMAELAVLLDHRQGAVGAARSLVAAGSFLCLVSGALRGFLLVSGLYDDVFVNIAFILAAFVRCFTQTAGCTMLVGDSYQRELERVSRLDPLTGLLNRRAFDEIAERLWAQAKRRKWPMAFLMIDLDHFKSVNDRFGHPGGDEVLKSVGDVLRHQLRKDDLFCRYGGEEFAVLLPATDAAQAHILAERIRQSCSAAPLPDGSTLTVSVGLAEARDGDALWQPILVRADQALYQAKAQGRDRVVALPAPA